MKRMNSLHLVQIAMCVANARTCVLHMIRIVRQLFTGQQLADFGIQPEFFRWNRSRGAISLWSCNKYRNSRTNFIGEDLNAHPNTK